MIVLYHIGYQRLALAPLCTKKLYSNIKYDDFIQNNKPGNSIETFEFNICDYYQSNSIVDNTENIKFINKTLIYESNSCIKDSIIITEKEVNAAYKEETKDNNTHVEQEASVS